MLPKEILRKIRRIEITTSRLVTDFLSGQYESVFKGRGMEFDEVREYQPGDEIRSIDWNVTARMGHPFVKKYVEERQITVMILLDASGSSYFGTSKRLKSELAANDPIPAAATVVDESTPAEASPNPTGQKKAEVVPPKGEKPRETCAVTKGCVGIPNHTRDCYDEDGHTLVVDGAVPSTTDGPEPPMGALEGDPKPETPKADDVTAEWEKVADFLIEKLGEVKAKPHLQNLKKKYAAEFDGVKLHAPDATKRLLEAWNAASDRVHTAPPKT